MSDQKRGLSSEPVVSQFRGLNRFVSVAELPPDSAQDCLNVICSLSGGLVPVRKPKPLPLARLLVSEADVTVAGTAMPWDNTLAGNAAYPYANGKASVSQTKLVQMGAHPATVATLTFDNAVGLNDVIVLLVATAGEDATGVHSWSITDNFGTVYTRQVENEAGSQDAVIYTGKSAGAGTLTITINIAGAGGDANSLQALGIHLLGASGVVNTSAIATGGGALSLTTTVANTFLFAVGSVSLPQNYTAAAGATLLLSSNYQAGTDNMDAGGWESRQVSATGTYTLTFGGGLSGFTVFAAIALVIDTSGVLAETIPGTAATAHAVTPGQQLDISATGTIDTTATDVAGPAGVAYSAGNPFPGTTVNGKFPAEDIAGETSAGPVKWGGLVGAFVDSGGLVISTFAAGSSVVGLVVPANAANVLLGINDNRFGSNTGSFAVHLSFYSLSPAAFTGDCFGLFDFQQADGTRQIVTIWGTKIFTLTEINGAFQQAIEVDDNPDNAAFWSFAESSNILFMANGVRMLKWTGQLLQNWGIKKPSKVPVIDSTATAGGITLVTGRMYRAAYRNSVIGTLSSASDTSATSGPVTSKEINVHIDATADAAADPQIDTVVWYATLDAGFTYYYHSEVPINRTGNTLLVDNDVDPSTSAPTQSENTVEAASATLQAPASGNNWQWLISGSPQWRTVNGPAVGAPLPEMVATQFGLNLPANATVIGVKVRVGTAVQSASTNYLAKLQLHKGGVAIGTAKTFLSTDFVLPTTYVQFDAGSSGDMWGIAALDPVADCGDSSFGFGVTIQFAQDIRCFLFDFTLFVYYTLPSSATTEINTLIEAQLINDPPPVGKYLLPWGGRILVGGIVGALQDIAYSGYEKILDGRVEEAFPPDNRLRLVSGADAVRGMGEVQAGVLFGTRSNEMFLLRGELEDVEVGVPLDFTEQCETLPFNAGFASHYAIVKTANGAVYLSAQRSIDNYAGVGKPGTMSVPIANILRDIAVGLEEKCIGVYYNYLDKDWYVLAVPYGVGVTKPNRLIVIDLDLNEQNNTGIFPFDIGTLDALAIVEEPSSGRPMIVVAQNGLLSELHVIIDGNNMLLVDTTVDAVPVTQPFWHSGWWGGDDPQTSKMFRHANMIVDGVTVPNKFSAEARFVNHKGTSTFRAPKLKTYSETSVLASQGKLTLNQKSRLCSIKVIFPNGGSGSLLQLWVSKIVTSER